jgi:cyanate lyase
VRIHSRKTLLQIGPENRKEINGIISAIDFEMKMERLPDPKGGRVKITMSGKLLPYKRY